MIDFYNYPFQSGFLVFTLGILFILSVYHVLLYFQHKDKLYLLYGAYMFFIIFSQFGHITDGFIEVLLKPIGKLKYYGEIYTECYYIIYFFFAFKFLNIQSEFPKWTRYLVISLYALLGFCLLKFMVYVISGNYTIVVRGYLIFVAAITLLSIIAYIMFFRSKNTLRYYIIIGGLILSAASYWSFYRYNLLVNAKLSIEPAYGILYIGFILENVLFSLGLGHKQKRILNERNSSQKEVILQLHENDRLRQKIQEKLEQDVKGLNERVKAEKIEAIKMKYDKELAELKVVSLRSQMNPHFIFNSLNSIKRYIIDNEKENAVYYLNKFSKLIRKILSASMEKEISLAEELETMELYVNIENIRFDNSIDFSINIDDSLNANSIKVPSLILQPFLENAIWHGLSLKKEDRSLVMKLKKEGDSYLNIHILDNGIGRARSAEIKSKKVHQRTSVGIQLTKERLSLFSKQFKNNYSLNIIDLMDKSKESNGTVVNLKIPLI